MKKTKAEIKLGRRSRQIVIRKRLKDKAKEDRSRSRRYLPTAP